MKFGPVSVFDAEGAIVAHSLRLPSGTVQKGAVLDGPLVAELAGAGLSELIVARPGPDDVPEDEAATRIARRLAGANLSLRVPVHGRVDVLAVVAGVVTVQIGAIDGINLAQDLIQVATVPEFAWVDAGDVVATIKVIPFAVPGSVLVEAERAMPLEAPLVLAKARSLCVGLVQTTGAHLKRSVLDKTRRVLDARLGRFGTAVATEERVGHDQLSVNAALRRLRASGHDLLIVFGASATSDARDVIPEAIRDAGGAVHRVGMPVDPGNLLVLAELDGAAVIGAPGCARSPASSGFDWVLERMFTGLPMTSAIIARMGVGGVLVKKGADIVPAPDRQIEQRVDAVILAAGQSARMQGPNKLLARIAGRPMVRIVAEAALASAAGSVTVVLGHQAEEVRSALAGLDVAFVRNEDYRSGLASSVRTGIAAASDDCAGAIVLLADMPEITTELIDRMLAAFRDRRTIVVPTFGGAPGNPVVWPRAHFAELSQVSGDKGGRDLIRAHAGMVHELELGPAVARDIDTPEAMATAGGTWS